MSLEIYQDIISLDGHVYRLEVRQMRPSIEPLGGENVYPAVIVLYRCACCGRIIEPREQFYCDDECKDRWHRWQRRKV